MHNFWNAEFKTLSNIIIEHIYPCVYEKKVLIVNVFVVLLWLSVPLRNSQFMQSYYEMKSSIKF